VTNDVEGGWDDRQALEHRGGTVLVEPSCGVVVGLGGSAQRLRWGSEPVMTQRTGGMAGERPDAVENAKVTQSQ
jgi:hypothetical protein